MKERGPDSTQFAKHKVPEQPRESRVDREGKGPTI